MPPSFRHTSGGVARRVRRVRLSERRRPTRGGSLSFGPTPLAPQRERRTARGINRPWYRRIELGAVFAGVLGLGTLVLVIGLAYRGTRVDLEQTGLEDEAVLNNLTLAAVEVRIELPSPDDAKGSELRFDGEVVEEPVVEANVIRWRPPEGLPDGDHRLELSVPRVLVGDANFRWDFTLDNTAPTIEAPLVVAPVAIDAAATVTGQVEEGVSLVAGGRKVTVEDDGSFTLSFSRPPAGPVVLEAVDPAGNRTTTAVVVPVNLPGMRAVHVTAAAWSDPGLRQRIVQLVDERRIDTVVLDLKDEEGVVGFDTTVPRAIEVGAVSSQYDLDQAVETIEEHGARVVGRIVTFQDPVLARAAWAAGQADQVIQTPEGEPYSSPGRFTNFAHPEVQRYNLDLALDAVNRGVGDIVWDYVRLPFDNNPDEVVVPNLTGAASASLTGFLADAHSELRRRGVFQGVAVEGLAVDEGDVYAQDVAQMARRADYLVPEIHPAFWSAGYSGVANPLTQPGDLVPPVLTRFLNASKDSGTLLAPSLQDYGARGVTYGEAEVRAQIDGARAVGVDRFILWDPSVTYTATALDPQA